MQESNKTLFQGIFSILKVFLARSDYLSSGFQTLFNKSLCFSSKYNSENLSRYCIVFSLLVSVFSLKTAATGLA